MKFSRHLQQRERFSAVTAGAIAQNVALYCASAGLVNVVRGWIDHRLLADALRLNEDELIPTRTLPPLLLTAPWSVISLADLQAFLRRRGLLRQCQRQHTVLILRRRRRFIDFTPQ